MIQRIQSILILLASGVLGLEFVFPFATSKAQRSGFFSDAIYNISDSPFLLGLVVAVIILGLISIFLYTNRKLQILFNWMAVLLCVMTIVGAYFLGSKDQSGNLQEVSFGLGAILPIISAILFLIANSFISKDENLVKSMDRLR